jgi:hypothetical protein
MMITRIMSSSGMPSRMVHLSSVPEGTRQL